MGPNEQNQHFAELRHKVSLYINVVVPQGGLQSMNDKLGRFITKNGKSGCQN